MACHNVVYTKQKAIAPLENSRSPFTHLRGISNDDTTFSPYANKRSVNHTGSPNHCNHRQSVGLLKNCKPEDVVTIWINSDDIVWVKITHGYARYHKQSFKRAVAEVKASLSAPVECNHKEDERIKTSY